ncbi:hypothetical protein [Aestuariivirga sp.]|uniref:hypothetical protein n=1 Tax=Aestuariivirga sp. TaxID=2650926 RepID=UPI0039E4A906
MDDFFARGWIKFPAEASVARWAEQALPVASATADDPTHADWMRCDGTWFVGVHALPNDGRGAIAGGPPLDGAAMAFIRGDLGFPSIALERAQVSICYPGYPRPDAHESAQAARYRVTRDSAHVDGLHAEGPDRRRFLREHHSFLLGVPLTASDEHSSPLTVWEGSHRIMRDAFRRALGQVPTEQWPAIDLTEIYQDARRKAFDICPRVVVSAQPGEAYLVHRLALHGVAPWRDSSRTLPRIICYFRPEAGAPRDWLDAP